MRIRLLFLLCFLFSASSISATVRNVLIVVAMQEEAVPIIDLLHLSPGPALDEGLPMKTYVGHYANKQVALVLNGKAPIPGVQNIGTQPAVLATYLGIHHFHPDIVLSIGTAGGRVDNGAKVDAIYTSDKIYFYARRMHSPEYQLYGAGGYPSMDTTDLIKKLNLKQATVCSSDSFEEDATDREVMAKYGCVVIDMEAAGVAWVAMLKQVPMFAIKGITNYTGSTNAHDEFEKHYAEVTKKLAYTTRDTLDYLK